VPHLECLQLCCVLSLSDGDGSGHEALAAWSGMWHCCGTRLLELHAAESSNSVHAVWFLKKQNTGVPSPRACLNSETKHKLQQELE
jgi:hypothetical protein